MMAYDRYFQEITALLNRIREGEREPIAKAAQLMADSIKNGGLIRIFGTGHSTSSVKMPSSGRGACASAAHF